MVEGSVLCFLVPVTDNAASGKGEAQRGQYQQ